MRLKDLFEEEKKQKNQMTFVNLMTYAAELLGGQPKKVQYVIVDEVQLDTQKQEEMIHRYWYDKAGIQDLKVLCHFTVSSRKMKGSQGE